MKHQQAVQNLAVESYLLGDMSSRERDEFENHFFECSLCGEDVRAAAKFMEEAREILGEDAGAGDRLKMVPPLPGPSWTAEKPGGRRTPGWLAWLKPQFAVPAFAALLVIVALQSIQIIPNLRRQVEETAAPRVVASIVLRSAVRGESGALTVPPGAAAVLILDLLKPPAKATPLQFIIESEDGKETLRVNGVAPDPGRSVNLMIPRLAIPPGPYTLVAEIAASAGKRGQELGRFPFRLELQ